VTTTVPQERALNEIRRDEIRRPAGWWRGTAVAAAYDAGPPYNSLSFPQSAPGDRWRGRPHCSGETAEVSSASVARIRLCTGGPDSVCRAHRRRVRRPRFCSRCRSTWGALGCRNMGLDNVEFVAVDIVADGFHGVGQFDLSSPRRGRGVRRSAGSVLSAFRRLPGSRRRGAT